MNSSIERIPSESEKSSVWFIALLMGLRAGLAGIIIVLAVIAGIAIPYGLKAEIAKLSPIGLGLGAATVLAVLRQLFDSITTLWDYVVAGNGPSLPKLFGELAIAVMGLGFACYSPLPSVATAQQAVPSGAAPQLLNLTVSGSLPSVVLNAGGSLLTSYVIFGEKTSALSKGIQAESDELRRVDDLVASLLACIDRPADRIRLVVRAFASSSGTDADNEKLYRDRAMYVRDLLVSDAMARDRNKAQQISVDVAPWPNLQAMEVMRVFKDTNSRGTYNEEAGALNRRAEIQVLSAGSCYQP